MLASTLLAVAGAVLTLVALYALPWSPTGYPERLSFLDVADAFKFEYLGWGWWVVPDSYFIFGFALHSVAVGAAPFVICREDRWHWLAGAGVLGAVWQFIAVQTSHPPDITVVPYLGAWGGLAILIAWSTGRAAVARRT